MTATHSDCWNAVERLRLIPWHIRRNVLLTGPPGTGKSYLGKMLAEADDLPSYNITVNGRTVPTDLLYGSWMAPDGSSILQARPGLQAWGTMGHRPGYLIVNEINECGDDALLALGALLDDRDSARVALPTGETVTPHEAFRCIGTANAAIDDLPERLLDRFPIRVLIDQPAPGVLDKLPEDLRRALVAAYRSLGWTLNQTGRRPLFSARELLAYAEMRQYQEPKHAAALIWGDRANSILDHLTILAQE